MNRAERLLRAADRMQQRHRGLSFGVAAWKKFGDDQAGHLAALIAYYAFAAIFPLLLVLVTVLDITLRSDPALRDHLLNSALAQYPIVGTQLKQNVHALGETGPALVVGLVFTFLGARGVAGAAQNAFNAAWEVPRPERPGFPWSLLRSICLILVVGVGQIITVTISGIAGGAGNLLSGAGAHVGAVAVSLVLNMGLFWLGFRLATAAAVATRDLRLGALVAAAAWQVLQLAGGFVVAHLLHRSSELYGTFGLVLGLIAWLYLQAQITMYAVEMNVTAARKLWPRSLFPPPYTPQDLVAYQMYARAAQRRPELGVEVREPGRDGATLSAARRPPRARRPQGHAQVAAQRDDGRDPARPDGKRPGQDDLPRRDHTAR
jgi:membrane protein